MSGRNDGRGHIRIEIDKGKHETAAESILDYLEKEHFGTIIIGRRGISKAEEFLYTITPQHLRRARECYDFGVRIEDFYSAIRNPQSKIRNERR